MPSQFEMDKNQRRDRVLLKTIAAGLFVVVCAPVLCAQATPSKLTTVCAVAAQPEKCDGKEVTVRARVFSDGEHGSTIYDESCEHYGVLLFVVSGAKGEDKLDAALNWCHRTTRGKLISDTFTGVFHFKTTYLGDTARPSISIQRVDDLVLKSTKTVSASFPKTCPEAPPVDSLVHGPSAGSRPD
jgi:hypothetical protein